MTLIFLPAGHVSDIYSNTFVRRKDEELDGANAGSNRIDKSIQHVSA